MSEGGEVCWWEKWSDNKLGNNRSGEESLSMHGLAKIYFEQGKTHDEVRKLLQGQYAGKDDLRDIDRFLDRW